jgi:hypothetical protein
MFPGNNIIVPGVMHPVEFLGISNCIFRHAPFYLNLSFAFFVIDFFWIIRPVKLHTEDGGTFNTLGGKLGMHTAWREALVKVYDIENCSADTQ